MVASICSIAYLRLMTDDKALEALAALAHPTRLATVRFLIDHEPEGLSTGQLVELVGLAQSTFSTHLAVLVKAGLVVPEKRGRQVIQHANAAAIHATSTYLSTELLAGAGEAVPH